MALTAIEKVTAMQAPMFPPGIGEGFISLFEADRQKALQSEDSAKEFLELATDVEVLAVISETSLRGPLNTEGYTLMMHLSSKVFTAAGIENIPDFVEEKNELSPYFQGHLNRLKRDLRIKQSRLK